MANIEVTEITRKILLSDEIDSTSIQPIIETIMEINSYDKVQEHKNKNYHRKPIRLYINSCGGSVVDGFALCDVIKQSKTPIYTISIGCSMSIGFIIFLCGHKRFIGENSILMFHDISVSYEGYTPVRHIEHYLKNSRQTMKIICNLITSTSQITQATLDYYIDRQLEWFIGAEEAIDLQLANDYYKEV